MIIRKILSLSLCLLVHFSPVNSFHSLNIHSKQASILRNIIPNTKSSCHRPIGMSTICSMASSSSSSLWDVISSDLSNALGRSVRIVPSTTSGGMAGGSGATTRIVQEIDSNNDDNQETPTRYFVKLGPLSLLMAEFAGVQELASSQTIRVPTPFCVGGQDGSRDSSSSSTNSRRGYAVFEYLTFTSNRSGSDWELGVQLAKLHRTISTNGFGFHVDTTIGATPQSNLPWNEDWADFWDTNRLQPMLEWTYDAGYDEDTIMKLRTKTKQLLSSSSSYQPVPSLLHGDLWGGNKGFIQEGNGSVASVVPVIFDPATYYGDREADIAMTYLFGGFGPDFYKGYESEWPLPEGHEKRRTIYNLYHILNHEVLFGGYLGQARSMIQQILRY